MTLAMDSPPAEGARNELTGRHCRAGIGRGGDRTDKSIGCVLAFVCTAGWGSPQPLLVA